MLGTWANDGSRNKKTPDYFPVDDFKTIDECMNADDPILYAMVIEFVESHLYQLPGSFVGKWEEYLKKFLRRTYAAIYHGVRPDTTKAIAKYKADMVEKGYVCVLLCVACALLCVLIHTLTLSVCMCFLFVFFFSAYFGIPLARQPKKLKSHGEENEQEEEEEGEAKPASAAAASSSVVAAPPAKKPKVEATMPVDPPPNVCEYPPEAKRLMPGNLPFCCRSDNEEHKAAGGCYWTQKPAREIRAMGEKDAFELYRSLAKHPASDAWIYWDGRVGKKRWMVLP